MNKLIVETSNNRLICVKIEDDTNDKMQNICTAFEHCGQFLDYGEIAENITVIYDGKVNNYSLYKSVQDFFKTI